MESLPKTIKHYNQKSKDELVVLLARIEEVCRSRVTNINTDLLNNKIPNNSIHFKKGIRIAYENVLSLLCD